LIFKKKSLLLIKYLKKLEEDFEISSLVVFAEKKVCHSPPLGKKLPFEKI